MGLGDLAGALPGARTDPGGRRRDALLAAGAFSIGLVLWWADAYSVPLNVGSGPVVLLGPLAVISATLLLRRTAPLLAVLIGLAAAAVDQVIGPSLAVVLILTQLLYDGYVHGRPWLGRTLLWAVGAFTVVAAAVALVLLRSAQAVVVAVVLALIFLGPVITAVPVRHHRDRAESARRHAEQVARLAELDRRHAVDAERHRMARELHDVIANHLSAIAIHATAAQSLRGADPATLDRALAVIRDNSVRGLAEMRQMIAVLRADGSEPATRTRLADVAALVERAGIPADLVVEGEARELPVAVELAGFRIVQESLTNAIKHAAGGTATVRLTYGPRALDVTVDSSGPARPAGIPGSGAGLIGMRERATLLGGEFRAGVVGDGWQVSARLPVGAP